MEGAHAVLPALIALDDDADDVRWALHTAQARWQAGGHTDALVWMRRAADAAEEAGDPGRAAELIEDAEDLAEQVWFSDKGSKSGAPLEVEIDVDLNAPEDDVVTSIAGEEQRASGVGVLSAPDLDEFLSLEAEPESRLEPGESEPPQATSEDEAEFLDELELLDDVLEEPLPLQSSLPPAPGSLRASAPPKKPSSGPPARGTSPPVSEPMHTESEAQRQSLTELNQARPPSASTPELEVEEVQFGDEELSAADIETLLGPSSEQHEDQAVSRRSFNDRLSSAEVVPESAEAAIPKIDSDPSSLSFTDSSELSELEHGGASEQAAAPVAEPSSEDLSAEQEAELTELISDEIEFDDDGLIDEGFAELAEVEAAAPGPANAPSEPGAPPIELASGAAEPPEAAAVPAVEAAESPTPEEVPEGDAVVDDIALADARGLEDLPEEVQLRLAKRARVEELNRGDEVGFFGAALITRGAVDILPAIADDAGAQARHGDVVFTSGTLQESIALRVEAKIDGTRVAVWSPEEIAAALESCPWVEDELRFIADHFLAVCGATLGPLGQRLDNALRGTVFSQMEVRACEPGQIVVEAGAPLDGLYVVGGGRVEVVVGETLEDELSPGDLLFPSTMLSAGAAPHQARAGTGGALLLYASRSDARELMMSIPPLLEILAG